MSQELKKKIYLVYGIVMALQILLVGICLVLSCLDIYHSGSRPFSRESIAAHYDAIKLPLLLCFDTFLGGIILSLLLPLAPERTRAKGTEGAVLRRLKARLGASAEPKEERLRVILRTVTAILMACLGIYPAVYLADSSHFGLADLNGDVLRALTPVLIATAAALILAAVCSLLCNRSVKREIAACKELLAMREQSPVAPADTPSPRPTERLRAVLAAKEKPIRLILRCVLLALAVVFIVLGVLNGGIDDVLGKAARICTECIGLG